MIRPGEAIALEAVATNAALTIARIDTIPVQYREPHDSMRKHHLTFVRIETDEGIVGWGECTTRWPEAALAAKVVIDRGFAPLLVGRDATRIGHLWQLMRDHSYWYGNGGVGTLAISGIDTALWDIVGKSAGLPVHALLGGKFHDTVRVCASVIFDTRDVDATCDELVDYKKRGFTAVKGGYGRAPDAHFGLDPKRDLELVRVVREAIGPEVDFAVDVSVRARWTASHAIRMARSFEEYDLFWLEDPLPHDDRVGYRRLRNAVDTPIATGERSWTADDYTVLVDADCVDIILVDPGRVEGITGFRNVVSDAARRAVRFVPHSWFSAINTAASLHLFASSQNGVVFEIKPNPSPMQHELVHRPFEQVDGAIAVPDSPGLGIDVDESVIRYYAFT